MQVFPGSMLPSFSGRQGLENGSSVGDVMGMIHQGRLWFEGQLHHSLL